MRLIINQKIMSLKTNFNPKLSLNTSLKHFPFSTFHKFCNVIIFDVWEQLAAKILNRSKTTPKFTYDDICSFRRSKNPAEEMMNAWKMDNPRFSDLVCILEEESLLRALTFIEDNVLESKASFKVVSTNIPGHSTVVNNNIVKSEAKKEELNQTINSHKINYETLLVWTNNFNSEHYHSGGNFINSGGFADVFIGTRNGGKVAVKRFRQPDQKQQFENETVLFDCHHSNLVKLLHLCDDGPNLCLVYEFVERGSLFDLLCDLKTVSVLTGKARVKVAKQTASALQYLHDNAIIHRDVKSANILLSRGMDAKLGDFGISKVINLSGDTHVITSTIVGTAIYMAPEYLFNQQVSPRIDMYSFGVVLLELAYGQPAYTEHRSTRSIVEMFEDDEEFDDCWKATNEATKGKSSASGPTKDVVMLMHEFLCKLLNRKKNQRPTAAETVNSLTRLEEFV